jgi:hypothetical protein
MLTSFVDKSTYTDLVISETKPRCIYCQLQSGRRGLMETGTRKGENAIERARKKKERANGRLGNTKKRSTK